MNCISTTLVPKYDNYTNIKDFRPIVCCPVLYKIIVKVLTFELKKVITKVVGEAQVGFMLGRVMTDNIHLAAKLVKGYNRKYMSLRCMVRIDL